MLLPRLTERAVYLATDDDRLVFVIPWREFSLVGTTDTDYVDSPDRVWATKADVQYLLAAARPSAHGSADHRGQRRVLVRGRAAPHLRRVDRNARLGRLPPAPRRRGGAGRPLPLRHRHQADVLPEPGGGSGPDHRAAARAGRPLRHRADHARRAGRGGGRPRGPGDAGRDRGRAELGPRARADRDARDHLRAPRAESSTRRGGCPGAPSGSARTRRRSSPSCTGPWTSELAVSLQDVLLRRTGLGTGPCLGLDCAPAIAQRMGALLGWSPRRVEAELDAYEGTVRQGLRFRSE